MTEKGGGPEKFTLHGVTYSIGDTVCLQPPQKDAPPFIGRIETIGAPASSGRQIRVNWFYRPEEAAGGRKAFHSVHELFTSDHFDWVDMGSVLYKCKIHTLAAFQSLSSPKSTDFFTRFAYKARAGQFKPDRIPAYCVCEMARATSSCAAPPYNPDLYMEECRWCLEWYHPECIGLDRVTTGADFICHECSEAGAGPAKRKKADSQS